MSIRTPGYNKKVLSCLLQLDVTQPLAHGQPDSGDGAALVLFIHSNNLNLITLALLQTMYSKLHPLLVLILGRDQLVKLLSLVPILEHPDHQHLNLPLRRGRPATGQDHLPPGVCSSQLNRRRGHTISSLCCQYWSTGSC